MYKRHIFINNIRLFRLAINEINVRLIDFDSSDHIPLYMYVFIEDKLRLISSA